MDTSRFGIDGFSAKAAAYARGRPTYPDEAVEFAIAELGLTHRMTVADIGAGTGLLTRSLIPRFAGVMPVEPNDDMRAMLPSSASKGTAENTNLPDKSVDACFAAQAFHWFDPDLAKAEFQRILKGRKPVALFWNSRQLSGAPGLKELESLLRSMQQVAPQKMGADEVAIHRFLGGKSLNKAAFHHENLLDSEGFRAMVLSRSYAPRKGEPGYLPLVEKLDDLMASHSQRGVFRVPYQTDVFWGWLG